MKRTDSTSYWKKILLVIVFFIATPLSLFSSVVSLVVLSNSNVDSQVNEVPDNNNLVKSGVQIYASLPSDYPSVSGKVLGADARSALVGGYLNLYNSPMEPYAAYIVEVSDRYDLDYRLTTAIAQKESNLGKRMPSFDCYNAWGLGIHSEGTWCFDSWEEGIETVSKILKEEYIDKGYLTVEEIMTKYAHPLSTTWADGVNNFMSQMK